MRIGCDSLDDAEELLRALRSWLKDPNCVVANRERDAALDAAIELADALGDLHTRPTTELRSFGRSAPI